MSSRTQRNTPPLACDLALLDGTVLTLDPENPVVDQGFVAVTGDRIVAVGDAALAERFHADRTVHCSGKVVMPGMVDCHNHLFQSLEIGRASCRERV